MVKNKSNTTKKSGALVVVGGGIAGMQSALDAANSGFKVYLVENKASIGGIMAQLDKTFPTNDCSTCMLSPKLIEVAKNPNIEIISYAEVADVAGKPGNFKVKVRKKPRYIDPDTCTSCGDCAAVCPVELKDIFDEGLSDRRAIYKLYAQAVPDSYLIEKEGMAPCRDACPINQRAQGYVALIRTGRYADAYRTILEDNPFPSVCGRVCNHSCEDACARGKADAPVNIMGLKRFVADWAWEEKKKGTLDLKKLAGDEAPEATGKRVAVVGAGPAGLTCAFDLVRSGHAVTVYEALPVAGGMMRVGIPGYRLPHELLEWEIERIIAEGVELRLNRRVEDIPALLDEGYDAVFVAMGTHNSIKLPISGADLPEVLGALDFLRDVSLRVNPSFSETRKDADKGGCADLVAGKRVLVVGGGNVAIDVAMTAQRLGAASTVMTCLESREAMPSHAWEIRDAEEEGIEILPARTFKGITDRDGHVTGMESARIVWRGFVNGRPDFDVVSGSEEVIGADVVIFAIGQRAAIEPLQDKVETGRGQLPVVDTETMATSFPGIFAGGDVATGTAFIVDAIAAGHKAARSINRYVEGGELAVEAARPPVVNIDEVEVRRRLKEKKASSSERTEMQPRPAAERRGDFGEIYSGLTEAEARKEAERCLNCGVCSECLQCVYVCRSHSIDHNQTEEIVELDAGAVILTGGLDTIPGDVRPEYGYGRYANVMTSIEFERMLSAAGPYAGVVRRLSDGVPPVKVAWIQCVGSRDASCGEEYCSSVCCMYATKQALVAKDHDRRIEPTIFYLDMRAQGKGFDRYYERARSTGGVRYIRSMVSRVVENPDGSLAITYIDGSRQIQTEDFGLVVLSVGVRPNASAKKLAGILDIKLNRFGFCETEPLNTTSTSREGFFVGGVFQGPKDIPNTVIQASGAAGAATALISDARDTMVKEKTYPVERDVSGQDPRIGVFVCHCGMNIAGVVDVKAVAEYAGTLPNVVFASHLLFSCSTDSQDEIKKVVEEHGLNRLVVASCSPRTHEPIFQDTLRETGLNKYLFEMANIRDQNSWVHADHPEEATEKAKDLARMCVARSARLVPLYDTPVKVVQSALVIGGGVASLIAALMLAEQGYKTVLVEKAERLGGSARFIHYTLEGASPSEYVGELIEKVEKNPLITVYNKVKVLDYSGHVGQFVTTISVAGKKRSISHGVVIIAMGGEVLKPQEYLYGQDSRVLIQREFEQQLVAGRDKIKDVRNVVMIQCVGSREKDHPYCSRVCCSEAIKNSRKFKELNPEANVYVLFRDIRTFGFKEVYYKKAREEGVRFIRYEPERKPEVLEEGDGLQVKVYDQNMGTDIVIDADRVVLSSAIRPYSGNKALARVFRLPLDQDGFFMEAHLKLRPLDLVNAGFFICGQVHGPKFMDESITQAKGAVSRACTILSKKQLFAGGDVARVDETKCILCLTCVRTCPYNVPKVNEDEGVISIDAAACQGCGNCAVACPRGAISVGHNTDEQYIAKIGALHELRAA